jgi:hypothetical protein
MRDSIRIALILLLAAVSAQVPFTVFAQWNVMFSYDREYNNNPFRYVSNEESWVSSYAFTMEYEWPYARFGYGGFYSSFDALADRNFYWHQGYVNGEIGKAGWGVTFEQRMNRSSYDYYDYRSASAYGGYAIGSGLWEVQLSVGGSINVFPGVDELDNKKLWMRVQGRKSFRTKTSVFAGGALHYKRYDTIVPYDEAAIPLPSPDNPEVTQGVIWLRLTQSLTSTTGLAAYIRQRSIIGGTNRFSSVYWFNGVLESELFDDPMGYEGLAVGIELTQLLPAEMVLKGAYNVTEKNYPDQGIFTDLETYNVDLTRSDTYRTFWFRLQKGIALKADGGIFAILSLNYQTVRNTSNSYWFGYKSGFISIGADLVL